MKSTKLISTVALSFVLLFQGCNQDGASSRRSTGSGDAIAAKNQMTSGTTGKGATKGEDLVDDKKVETKGDTTTDDKKTDDTKKDDDKKDDGKTNPPADNDDDKDGKTDTPSQNPGQNPQDDGKDDTPVDIPPVEIPKKACVYFDPDQPEFVLKKNQFGANLPPIDVPSHMIKGEIQPDTETYIGAFTVFEEKRNSGKFMAKWDGKTGRIPYDYTMVVVNSVDDSCTAFVRFVKQQPRTNNGCFAQHTKIRMASGEDRVIALINPGDIVLNPVTGKGQKVSEVRKGKEAKPMYAIAFGGRSVMVTDTHPMPVRGGIKMAKDVTAADYLFDEKGVIHKVSAAKKLLANPEQIVVNISLESASSDPMQHMVLADGIVSGDLYLQRKLENPKMTAGK